MNSAVLAVLLVIGSFSMSSALECYDCHASVDSEECWKVDGNTSVVRKDTNGEDCARCVTYLANDDKQKGTVVRECVSKNDFKYNEAPIGKCVDTFDGSHKRRVCHCDKDKCNGVDKQKADSELKDFNPVTAEITQTTTSESTLKPTTPGQEPAAGDPTTPSNAPKSVPFFVSIAMSALIVVAHKMV